MSDPKLLAATIHTAGTVRRGPLPDGCYPAVIAGVDIGRPRRDDARVAVVLAVTGGPFAGTTAAYACHAGLERRAPHAPYPAFARLLEAATGIACGDEAQRALDERALLGQCLEITLRAGFDGTQRVVGFGPPSTGAGDLARVARERSAVRSRIAALVRGAGVDAASLRDLIASVSRGRTRNYARLRAVEADALASRLRGTR